MKIDFCRLRQGMTIRVFDSEQALQVLEALSDAGFYWISKKHLFSLDTSRLRAMRGFCIESIERKLLSHYDSSEVNIMLNNEDDIVDFCDVIFYDEVPDDLPNIDLSEFLE